MDIIIKKGISKLNKSDILNKEEMESIINYALDNFDLDLIIKCANRYYYSGHKRANIDFSSIVNTINKIVNKLIAEEGEKFEYHELFTAPWGQVSPAHFTCVIENKIIRLGETEILDRIKQIKERKGEMNEK